MSYTSINSGSGLVPVWHQTITWINTDLLWTGTMGTNFSEIWIKTQPFSLKKYISICCLQNVSHFGHSLTCLKHGKDNAVRIVSQKISARFMAVSVSKIILGMNIVSIWIIMDPFYRVHSKKYVLCILLWLETFSTLLALWSGPEETVE